MICSRCLLRASRYANRCPAVARPFSSHPSRAAATEPFTTPIPASPASHELQPRKKAIAAVAQSSVPAGTPLKGLNFMKDKTDPVAMEDSEYPDWLWTILKDQQGKGDAKQASAAKLSKKAAKKAAKKASEAVVDIPLHEQTIDLYSGDGTETGSLEALRVRRELTKALRTKRRSAIKEDNFLRLMG